MYREPENRRPPRDQQASRYDFFQKSTRSDEARDQQLILYLATRQFECFSARSLEKCIENPAN